MDSTKEGTRVPLDVPPILITVDEAAQCLRVGRSYMYMLMKSNQIRSVKMGSKRLIQLKSLKAFEQRLTANDGLIKPEIGGAQ